MTLHSVFDIFTSPLHFVAFCAMLYSDVILDSNSLIRSRED